MTGKISRKQVAATALGLAIIGLVLVSITQDWALQRLQSVKYGTPVKACVGHVGVALSENWLIDIVVEEPGASPLLFGLFPVPKSLMRLTSDARLIVVRSIDDVVSVSIHPDSKTMPSLELVENCSKNSDCSITTSKFSDKDKVAMVRTGDAIWETFLDRSLMIGIHGKIATEFPEIRVSTCP